MNGELILCAFERAGKEIENGKKYPRAAHLSLLIEEAHFGETISPRTLVHYYENALENARGAFPLRPKIREALFRYLGYKDYEEFLIEHLSEEKKEIVKELNKGGSTNYRRRRIRIDFSISISLMLIMGMLGVF